ncbi:EMBRYO SURROUNDING FACTOR 1-like protein 8 [Raphanus sativus]|uniref:EMBRYO SURROUNDING FACTOR 1-like protein 8 n=1 Tax=Raphanus sativus TaxID=3726 RepID=A0A9W3BXK7_RAPSA|nr:EMBRYO SURROUNDING FACTOR 1-like protein 8 [Raphanus sativus]
MSSSQFVIFCIILITLFPRREFVDGQVLGVGKEACKQIKCGEDNKLNCNCCVSNDGNQYRCYAKMEFCKEMCGIML